MAVHDDAPDELWSTQGRGCCVTMARYIVQGCNPERRARCDLYQRGRYYHRQSPRAPTRCGRTTVDSRDAGAAQAMANCAAQGMLCRYPCCREHLCFGLEIDPYSTMFPTTPTRWMSNFIKRHNLPDVSPHDLRHTCGTLLLMSGATIKDTQDFLGHEDAKTTLAFYAASSPESLRKAAEGLSGMLCGTI